VGPSREEVAERFLIELTDSDEMAEAMQELADQIAGDALAGRCGETGYETGLQSTGDETLFYAWRSTCLMYFEGDLSSAQVAETKQMIADRVLAN
jgi:hypothetical protein